MLLRGHCLEIPMSILSTIVLDLDEQVTSLLGSTLAHYFDLVANMLAFDDQCWSKFTFFSFVGQLK